jgi:hypothetical protein
MILFILGTVIMIMGFLNNFLVNWNSIKKLARYTDMENHSILTKIEFDDDDFTTR